MFFINNICLTYKVKFRRVTYYLVQLMHSLMKDIYLQQLSIFYLNN
jgi:hypothetical protein